MEVDIFLLVGLIFAVPDVSPGTHNLLGNKSQDWPT